METQTSTQNPEIKLDNKSKILFIVIGLLIAVSVAVTYWRIVVRRDYIVQAQTECDPETEKCFIWECDPESDVEGEACTGDPETDIWYYKIIRRNAMNIPNCDPNDEECTALVCPENEADCSEELCTDENVPEGETCNDPEQYLLENPPEEECASPPTGGDEECLAEQEATECEEGDESCAEESAEECAPDDQECLDAQGAEDSEAACPLDDESCQEEGGGGTTDTQPETNSDSTGEVPLLPM